MRRFVAVFVSLSLAFGGLLFASPALAVDGEAKDVFAARVIPNSMAKHSKIRDYIGGKVIEKSASNLLEQYKTAKDWRAGWMKVGVK